MSRTSPDSTSALSSMAVEAAPLWPASLMVTVTDSAWSAWLAWPMIDRAETGALVTDSLGVCTLPITDTDSGRSFRVAATRPGTGAEQQRSVLQPAAPWWSACRPCTGEIHGPFGAARDLTTERRFGRRPHAHGPPTLVCLPWKNLRETCRRTTVVPRRARRRSNRRVPKAGHAASHPQTHIARAVCDMGHTSQVSLCASLFQALNVRPALPRVNDA